MKRLISYFYCVLLFTPCLAQEETPDTSKTLTEVTVRSFEQNRGQNSSTASVRVIDLNNSDRHNKSSLVSELNAVAGVRMEERSPGSYRLNIRGSSLRSPFGVRNIKVYWNGIPVTDAGGNTYFNQFAWNNFSSIELFKGPASSMYGTGTGGLILLNSFDRWQPGASLEYVAGSYGTHNIFASARYGRKENRNQITYAHNQSEGYRDHTRLRRDNFSWLSQLRISENQQLTASVLFTDMYYQTPGALTLAEYNINPKAERPAAGGFPSATGAKAAISQRNILAGFTNYYKIDGLLENSTTLYGTFSQVKNPTFRNYEKRHEPGFGGRTVFNWKKEIAATTWQVVGGCEFQQGYYNTQVSKNRNGDPDTIQTNDEILITTYNFFAQSDIAINNTWFVTGGFSINKNRTGIARLNRYPVISQNRTYQSEIAPRISIRRNFNGNFSILGTVSKGFSPPTISELLPSTGVISTNLEAEQGWNYEFSFRKIAWANKLRLELTGFYFALDDALVQRRDVSGGDFFVNSGIVRQKGIEASVDYFCRPSGTSLIDYINLQIGYSYHHFRYGTYIKGVDDFSGNIVPSVPENTIATVADLQLDNGAYTSLSYYGASKIFLNDGNTASAKAYHLLGWRIGWKKILQSKFKLNFYAGAQNLLDEIYSLGNDINAAGGRYYNAAPRRNYYVGIAFQLNKSNTLLPF